MCLHGFLDTWRTWELVLPTLDRHHEVLAPTLAGHAGGPDLGHPPSARDMGDAVERAMDAAGFETAHLVGNSLGGHLALRLAMRGRARSVLAFAPAGGWEEGGRDSVLALQADLIAWAPSAAIHAEEIVSTFEGRRRATRLVANRFEHIPAELIAHQLRGVAGCRYGRALLEAAATADWSIDPARIACPVRVVWGTADLLLPWPACAARRREVSLPHADWVVLDDVGHCPQLEVPVEAAQLVLGLTGG